MVFANPDKEWETYGKTDPYFGVLTEDKFSQKNLTEKNREDFFRTGRDHCENVIRQIRENIHPAFAPQKILDYGCGVGRLLIPFAKNADSAFGVDISPSMLAETAKNAKSMGLDNIHLHLPADLPSLPSDFDFVHSCIVFQHIPRKKGETLFQLILTRLRPGGIAAIHIPYQTHTRKAKIYFDIMSRIPFAQNLWNLLKKRPWHYPLMQMNNYSPIRLIEIASSLHCPCRHIQIIQPAKTDTHKACFLYFQRIP